MRPYQAWLGGSRDELVNGHGKERHVSDKNHGSPERRSARVWGQCGVEIQEDEPQQSKDDRYHRRGSTRHFYRPELERQELSEIELASRVIGRYPVEEGLSNTYQIDGFLGGPRVSRDEKQCGERDAGSGSSHGRRRLSPPGASRCLPNRPSRPIGETGSDVRYRVGKSDGADGKQTSASPLREVRHEPETAPKDASKKHSSPSPKSGAAQAASASSGGHPRSRRSRPGQSSGRHTTWLESSGIAVHVPLRLSPSRPVNEHGSPTFVAAHAASASSGGPSRRRLPGGPSPKLDADAWTPSVVLGSAVLATKEVSVVSLDVAVSPHPNDTDMAARATMLANYSFKLNFDFDFDFDSDSDSDSINDLQGCGECSWA